jgi:hypothetical protein
MALRDIEITPGTNLQSVAYDDDTSDLFIVFQRGDAQYVYHQVSQTTADGFQTSGLPAGAYFRANILNQYGYERVG